MFTIGTLSVFSQRTPCDPNNPVVPSVVLSKPTTTICTGDLVTITATPINGGSQPTYNWFIGGVLQVYNGSSLTFIAKITDDDKEVKVIMTSSSQCTVSSTVTSNLITLKIQRMEIPAIGIGTQPAICAGTSIKLTTITAGGGTSPVYEWYLNGIPTGTNSSFYLGVFNDKNSI